MDERSERDDSGYITPHFYQDSIVLRNANTTIGYAAGVRSTTRRALRKRVWCKIGPRTADFGRRPTIFLCDLKSWNSRRSSVIRQLCPFVYK
jgi:hypothetical protein